MRASHSTGLRRRPGARAVPIATATPTTRERDGDPVAGDRVRLAREHVAHRAVAERRLAHEQLAAERPAQLQRAVERRSRAAAASAAGAQARQAHGAQRRRRRARPRRRAAPRPGRASPRPTARGPRGAPVREATTTAARDAAAHATRRRRRRAARTGSRRPHRARARARRAREHAEPCVAELRDDDAAGKLSVTSRGAGCPTTPSSPRVAMTTLETAYSTPNRAAVQPAQRGAWVDGMTDAPPARVGRGSRPASGRDLGRTPARPAADLAACAPTYARRSCWPRAQLARPAPRRRRRRRGRGAAAVLPQHVRGRASARRRRGRRVHRAPVRAARRAPARPRRDVRGGHGPLRRGAAARRQLPRGERRRAGRPLHPRRLRAAAAGRGGCRVALAGTVPFALHFDDLSQQTLAWVVLTVHLLLAALLGDRTRSGARAAGRDAAASEERARIARELHDVVAHSLSVVIAQADGGRYAAEHDPAAATEALTHDRAQRPRGAGRDAPRARPARATPRRCTPSPASGEIARSSSARARRDCRSASTRGRRAPVAPAAGMTRLPRRPGGADERAQARRPGRRRVAGAALGARAGDPRRPRRRRRARARPTAAGAASRGCASASSRAAARCAPGRGRRAASRSRRRSPRDPRLPRRRPGARARGFRLVIDSQPDMTVVGEAGRRPRGARGAGGHVRRRRPHGRAHARSTASPRPPPVGATVTRRRAW